VTNRTSPQAASRDSESLSGRQITLLISHTTGVETRQYSGRHLATDVVRLDVVAVAAASADSISWVLGVCRRRNL